MCPPPVGWVGVGVGFGGVGCGGEVGEGALKNHFTGTCRRTTSGHHPVIHATVGIHEEDFLSTFFLLSVPSEHVLARGLWYSGRRLRFLPWQK